KEDKDFLYILIPFMRAIHKQGMIHQLANIEGENVWWCKEANLKKGISCE
ncbi:ABC-three component system protein, partial [Vibrio anguillarum]